MDWKTFIDGLIGKLSWPIAILIIVFAFKKNIVELIKVVARIKFKDFEIWFQRELKQIKGDAISENIPDITQESKSSIEQNVQKYPVESIIKAWTDLEKAIYEKLKQLLPKDSIQYKRLTI